MNKGERYMNREKTLTFFIALFILGASFLGHTPIYFPVMGLMITNVKSPIAETSKTAGSKTGEATADTLLGLIAHGDASIEKAAINGGITKIMTVKYKSYNILGVFARFTTIVTGE